MGYATATVPRFGIWKLELELQYSLDCKDNLAFSFGLSWIDLKENPGKCLMSECQSLNSKDWKRQH